MEESGLVKYDKFRKRLPMTGFTICLDVSCFSDRGEFCARCTESIQPRSLYLSMNEWRVCPKCYINDRNHFFRYYDFLLTQLCYQSGLCQDLRLIIKQEMSRYFQFDESLSFNSTFNLGKMIQYHLPKFWYGRFMIENEKGDVVLAIGDAHFRYALYMEYFCGHWVDKSKHPFSSNHSWPDLFGFMSAFCRDKTKKYFISDSFFHCPFSSPIFVRGECRVEIKF